MVDGGFEGWKETTGRARAVEAGNLWVVRLTAECSNWFQTATTVFKKDT